jgi:hypothetical protein
VFRTIREQIAFADDDLVSAAKSFIHAKFLILFRILRHNLRPHGLLLFKEFENRWYRATKRSRQHNMLANVP